MTNTVAAHTPMLCQHCRKPIADDCLYISDWPYHPECTRGPTTHAWPNWTPLDEAAVRRIVQDELIRARVVAKPVID